MFHSVKEVFIRGNTIKYFSLDSDLLSRVEGTEYVCPEKWKKADQKQHKFRAKASQ